MGKTTFQIPAAGKTAEEATAAIEAIKGLDISGVDDLAAAEQTVTDEANGLAELEDPSVEQLDRLDALVELVERIRAEGQTRDDDVQKRRDRAAAAKAKLAGPADGGEGESGDDGDGEESGEESDDDDGGEESGEESGDDDGAEDGEQGEDGEQENPDAVAAAARKRGRAPSLLRGRTKPGRSPKPAAREDEDQGGVTITASAGIRGVEAGSELSDMDAMVEAFMTRAASHPRGHMPDQYQRHAVASISRGAKAFGDLTDISEKFRDDPLALLDAAADETRLVGKSGKGGSLAAAGGWCAPSETLYDFVSLETTDGLYDMPEVGVKRGGLNVTMGPDFSDIYTNSGFTQTEAQAIAGETKTCYEVDCPDFEETRLDAIGTCIKNGFLTNTAYPELVRRVLAGAMVAHEHKKAVRAVNAVASELGTAVTLADGGSTARNILTGLELAAEGQRNQFHMGVNTTMEVVLPHWTRAAMRDDLQARLRMIDAVTDAQLDAHFAARKLRVQFIYGFGDAHVVSPEGSNTLVIAFPATFPALIYPAGTFVKGVADVINLDTVYDSTDIEVNVYTALFLEEAMLVVRRAPGGGRLTIPTNQQGKVGPADLPAWAEQA